MDNKQTVTDFVDKVLNQQQLPLIDAFISPAFVNHSRNAIPGIDGVRKYFAMLNGAFPDRKVTITQLMSEGDLVNIYTEWTGTHTGSFLNYPASGRQVTVYTSDLYRLKEGRIIEHWDVVNNTEMMLLIGALSKK